MKSFSDINILMILPFDMYTKYNRGYYKTKISKVA